MSSTKRSTLPKTSGALIYESALSGALAQKATTVGLSAFLWAIWLGLWAPLLTYVFWLVAPFWGAATVIDARDDSLPVLALLTALGLALGALLILGGALQWANGAARQRPVHTPSVTIKQLAAAHNLPPALLSVGWKSQRIVVHHLPEGGIDRLEL